MCKFIVLFSEGGFLVVVETQRIELYMAIVEAIGGIVVVVAVVVVVVVVCVVVVGVGPRPQMIDMPMTIDHG